VIVDDTPAAVAAGLRDRPADPAAREAFVRVAGRIALRTALGMTGDRQFAEDVAQESCLTAMRRIGDLRDAGLARAWLQRIAASTTLSALRRSGRRGERLVAAAPEQHAAAEPDRDWIARRALDRALDALPERERLALVLRYVHDLTEPEVAAAMGCRTGTAASLLSRGRAALRVDPAIADLSPASPRPMEPA
jgi:RNA polymerase sigma-70 factor (ECF subfamily)